MWPQAVNALLRFTFYLPLSSSAAFDGFMFYFVGDFCVKNNQINMNDELSFYVYAVGNEDNTYPGSLQPGKLEIYEDNQWKNIELSDDARFPEIIILIENLRPGYFSIPIFQDYVGLHSGHYRYIHTIEGINIPMEFDVL